MFPRNVDDTNGMQKTHGLGPKSQELHLHIIDLRQ